MNDLFRFVLLRPPRTATTAALAASQTLSNALGGNTANPAEAAKNFLSGPSAVQSADVLVYAKPAQDFLQKLAVKDGWTRSEVTDLVIRIFGASPESLTNTPEYAAQITKAHDTLIAAKLASSGRTADLPTLTDLARAAAIIAAAAAPEEPPGISEQIRSALKRNFVLPNALLGNKDAIPEVPSGRTTEEIAKAAAEREREAERNESARRAHLDAIAELQSFRPDEYELGSSPKLQSETIEIADKSHPMAGMQLTMTSVSYDRPPTLRLRASAAERLSLAARRVLESNRVDARAPLTELFHTLRSQAAKLGKTRIQP